MKDFLMKLIQRKKEELQELQRRSDASEDLKEVRSIETEIKKIMREIEEGEEQLKELEKAGEPDVTEVTGAETNVVEGRSVIPNDAVRRNAPFASVSLNYGGTQTRSQMPGEENVEYRKAFMENVLRNTPIPKEVRADENTLTSDVGTVIPKQLVNQIIEKFDNIGMIMPLITKTSYAAGIEIPVSTVKPVASWVAEGKGSDRQKKTTGKIIFSYFKLRCEISMSMEVGTMALSAFEAKFVENVSKAMVEAIENAVINGTGEGQPKGILKETAPSGQAITVKNGAITYETLCSIEAAIPEEYEGTAKYCMSKKTFMSCMAITDKNGQPIARVNYGIGGKPERTILGREVVLASKYMPNLDAATENTFMFAFDFGDYVLNTIYDMGISKKQDWDTEDLLTKAVMSVDGKPVIKDSLVTVSNTVAA